MTKAILKLEVRDDKQKKEVMGTVSGFSGLDSISMDMKEKKLTVIGDIDPVNIVRKLRKLCHTEIVSIGPAKEPEKKKEDGKKKGNPEKKKEDDQKKGNPEKKKEKKKEDDQKKGNPEKKKEDGQKKGNPENKEYGQKKGNPEKKKEDGQKKGNPEKKKEDGKKKRYGVVLAFAWKI